jgi:hypothetical protein
VKPLSQGVGPRRQTKTQMQTRTRTLPKKTARQQTLPPKLENVFHGMGLKERRKAGPIQGHPLPNKKDESSLTTAARQKSTDEKCQAASKETAANFLHQKWPAGRPLRHWRAPEYVRHNTSADARVSRISREQPRLCR